MHVEAIADSSCLLAAGPILHHRDDSLVKTNPFSSALHRRPPPPAVPPLLNRFIVITAPARVFLGSISVRTPPCLSVPLSCLSMFVVVVAISCRYSMLIIVVAMLL